MRSRSVPKTGIAAACGMLILILDTQTAVRGATDGIALCIQTVIPSLLPFFVLSILLTSGIMGQPIALLRPVCKLCGIPAGAESLLAVGILGGYPVGAQCVSLACRNGQLEAEQGRRMLAFCNNAGPAFLFGIGMGLFPNRWMCWAIWIIHIFSALAVGAVLPGKAKKAIPAPHSAPIGIAQALQQALRVLASVCGWVVLFRVVLAFAGRWFLWMLPQTLQVALSGLTELTNGCCALKEVSCVGLRFVMFCGFLGIGGLCVAMQTHSVCHGVPDVGLYFLGKLAQSGISLLFADVLQLVAFPQELRYTGYAAAAIGAGTLVLGWIGLTGLGKTKNCSSIFRPARV